MLALAMQFPKNNAEQTDAYRHPHHQHGDPGGSPADPALNAPEAPSKLHSVPTNASQQLHQVTTATRPPHRQPPTNAMTSQ